MSAFIYKKKANHHSGMDGCVPGNARWKDERYVGWIDDLTVHLMVGWLVGWLGGSIYDG